jgi:hypothetical protein
MATLASNAITLADWSKRLDPNGGTADIVEMLSQTNEILEDATFMEGNLPTGHRVTIRTGLPSVYWRAMNQGVPSSKSTTAQVDESCGMLEAYSPVDKKLVALNGNSAAFRLSEDAAFLEAMNQTQAQTLFYGNPAIDPKQFLGLAPRYSSLSAGNGTNIIDAGGTGSNNTSIYLVVWGANTVFCPFPKGSKAGLTRDDQGEVVELDANGNKFQALRTHYSWDNGLAVKDWRYVVRIANINITDLLTQSGTQAPTEATNIIKLMMKAFYKVPNMGVGKAAFYMNRSVHSGLSVAALDKAQYVLQPKEGMTQFGTAANWLTFQGVPLRRVDQLLNTESRVV